ncbi:MAG TPA: glycosyltransferase 87 family protein [Thermoleophilia bacterium]|nr:glycosyltransferase 87 family protein [Thermoleophilia bacterium]
MSRPVRLALPRAGLRAGLGLAALCGALGALALIDLMAGGLLAHRGWFAILYLVSAAGFGLLATAATSLPLRVTLVAAVAVRLAFLPVTPSLSTDVYRYLWDGRVQLAGLNPYRYVPRDHHLDAVGYADRARVNHPGLRTVYPPLAEIGFAALAALHGGVLALKLVVGVADLLAAWAVWWLADTRRRRTAVTLYLLCPAIVLQTWEAGHLEIVAVLFIVVAAGLIRRGRDPWAGLALGAAAAIKITPAALLVPALVGGRARPARLLAGFLPALLLPYLPYLLWGAASGSLTESGTRWLGGSFAFAAVRVVLPAQAARLACAAVFLIGAVWLSSRWRGRSQTGRAFAWTAALLVVCLPVVHAWYWLAPLVLGLAAGEALPVLVGLLAPLPEALAPALPSTLPPWR